TVLPSQGDAADWSAPAGGQFSRGVDGNGNIIYGNPLPDPTGNQGNVLGVTTSGGSQIYSLISNTTSTPWVTLPAPVSGTVTWTPIAGQVVQNGILTLTSDVALAVDSSTLQNGMVFNLVVVQNATGGWHITSLP